MGYLYGTSGNEFGLLNSSGNWQVRIEAGNANMELYRVTYLNDARPYITYDRDNTGYYSDPNGTSRYNYMVPNRIKLVNNVNNEPRWDFTAYVMEAQHWYGNNSSMTMYIGEGNAVNAYNMRSDIYYDRDDTAWYTNPASTSRMRNIDVCSIEYSASYNSAAIEVREYNMGGVQADAWEVAPRIGFHWGGRVASSIAMSSNGWINIMNNPGTGWETLRTAQLLSNGEVYAYYSDMRLKTKVGSLDNAVDKIKAIETFKYVNNELANSLGFNDTLVHVGVSAQSVEAVLPEVVKHAPFDIKVLDGKEISESGEWYKTVQYDKLVPLLIEGIKEQQVTIEDQESRIKRLEEIINKLMK
jgi:hypothetical protein